MGNFSDSGQSLSSSGGTPNDVALGDLDGDGDLDVFVAMASSLSGRANKVWFNNGGGIFIDSGQSLGNKPSKAVALGDLDGDGDLDAFVGNGGYYYISDNRVWLNNGAGVFVDSGQALGDSPYPYTYDLALGDLDGDGDLDAFIGNNFPIEVWLNTGDGTFNDSGQSLDGGGLAVALGDLDGDGDLDAVVWNNLVDDLRVWLNDGMGTYSDSGQSLDRAGPLSDVALGDLDGDGDLDIFVAKYQQKSNTVWVNNGLAEFFDSGQSLGSSSSMAVDLDDLDGEGGLDAFVANFGSMGGGANKVWLNKTFDYAICLPIVLKNP